MNKKICILLIGVLLVLDACGSDSIIEENGVSQTQEEIMGEQATESTKEENSSEQEPAAPTKDEVMKTRAICLEGMADDDVQELTETIKSANLVLEHAYLYDNMFERMADPNDLSWNYVDKNGEIVIGYAFESGQEYDESCGMSYEEYAQQYGKLVMTENEYDADTFVKMMEKMKTLIPAQNLHQDFDNLITYMKNAKETHDVQYIKNIYYIVHDMDYFLLRYGPEDVGVYIIDDSTVTKYYGVLSVYKNM